MAFLDRFRSNGSDTHPVKSINGTPVDRYPVVSLSEVRDRYEIVEVTREAIVVVDPAASYKMASVAVGTSGVGVSDPTFAELGSSGFTQYGYYMREDYNADLRGHLGLRKFDQMRRSDAQVRMSLRLLKTPVLAARWYMEPASDSVMDRRIADFIWSNLTEWMTISWQQFLIETLLCADYGHYMFEKVFTILNGKVIWKKFAPRHPLDAYQWEFDENGGPLGRWFYSPKESGDAVFIPIDKLLVFSYDREGGDLEGISALRSAYKHWYFKENLYKIDAIQKERHGIGIPVIKLPPNFSDNDKKVADQIGRNLRTNEKAHVVLPPMWEVEFAQISGQPVDSIVSIEHHDMMIARNVLGQFVNVPREQAASHEIFMKATRFVAEGIRDVINKYAIPELVDYNWKTAKVYPELKVRRIGDTTDWRTMSFAIRNFVGAGVIRPDDELEEWIRDEMDLPKPDVSTVRETATPQLPRQATAAGMKGGPGGGNVGGDVSGGK